ncbi:glycosyltransferase family 4 protein [uncultured Maribacter sp.]|uniref:glycosyltransferase family 4 protein n=1 Tax=uncultured Maribacter sp. TaxID=431308 RepID=UPI00262557D7|nr:glycosyltransferase family 4 protein [uncultured Maribacter sp.]
MKILWVTNQILPDIAEYIGLEKSNSGGWMYGLASNLKQNKDIELHIASAHHIQNYLHKKINDVDYHLLPSKIDKVKYDNSLEKKWKKAISIIKPDIIHIHGTEYAHGLALINACPNLNFVVSVQGLISLCEKYYQGGISSWKLFKKITFRDIVRWDTVFLAKKKFYKRGIYEKQYLQKVSHVMGRTDWDRDNIMAINPNINYHFCNEILRDSFYNSDKWDIEKKEDYTIFLSQCYYPLKGLHQVLKALYLVKKKIPAKIKLQVAGDNIIKLDTIEAKLKLSGYGNYIVSLIKKYNLKDNIEFLGVLDEKQMISQYLKSHIFICPSSIENSSNSLGEAQILGVPSIASYVGGNPNMIEHGVNGFLYRFEETNMLSEKIIKLFSDNELSEKISKNSIITAEKRHHKKDNVEQNINIYKKIIHRHPLKS